MSKTILIVIILVGCALLYFLFKLIMKYLEDHDTGPVVVKSDHIDIARLALPPPIEEMSGFLVSSICRKIYEAFELFEYHNADEETLEKKEWHSWQISMLLKLYKEDLEFFIPNPKPLFPASVTAASPKELKSKVTDLLKKHRNYVKIDNSKDALCKDVIWSNYDTCVLFYFLATYKAI